MTTANNGHGQTVSRTEVWPILQRFVALVFVVLALLAYGYGALTVEILSEQKRTQLWGVVTKYLKGIQIGTLVSTLAAISFITFVEFRKKRGQGHDSFWEAFPFASLVFFVVAVFMLCDVAGRAQPTDPPVKILLELGLYLVAALVTSIVVLYGAHLVRFEGHVSGLVGKVDLAGEMASNAAAAMGLLLPKAENLTKKAENSASLLTDLSTSAGMAILALRVDARYRAVAPPPPKLYKGKGIDPYVRARSCHAIVSDEAAFTRADQQELDPTQVPVARNIVSSFLEEMAWDLGQRKLVTNAHNYTSLLVNAARGFEDACDGNPDLRVFYLTHTVVTPCHLLNWPRDLLSSAGTEVRYCQPIPFMLEYMTYCRYFACKNEHFIHARVISAECKSHPLGEAQYSLAKEPFRFPCAAVFNPDIYDLPTKCNRWGIPHWGNVAVADSGNPQPFYDATSYPRADALMKSPQFPSEVIPHLFASFPHEGREPRASLVLPAKNTSLQSLHWPLFYKGVPDVAGQRPPLETIAQELTGFATNLSNELLDSCQKDANKKNLVEEGYAAFCQAMNGYALLTGDVLNAAHEILMAFEFFQGFRWAFQSDTGAKAWDDLRTAVLLLVNVLLSEHKNKGVTDGSLMEFAPWFRETFHTCPELEICYPRNADAFQDSGYAKDLGKKEFALIGLMQLDKGNMELTPQLIMQSLAQWEDKSEGPIQQMIGLFSSIEHPWKFAEMEWMWGGVY